MLEHLFGSKTRVKLLSLFLKNSDKSFFVRELTRKLNLQINAIRRELLNLETIGIIKINDKADTDKNTGLKKKYYQLNTDFIFCPELKILFIKSQLFVRQRLLDKLVKLGKIDYLVLTGLFTNEKSPLRTDMLVVGRLNRENLNTIVEKFESDLGHKVNYTVMSLDEFRYRKDITDKFLYEILEGKKIVVIDKIS